MSIYADYKTYKKFVPEYSSWKEKRDLAETKRIEYLKKYPEERNKEDIQRGKTLIRAIDIMDEYSQKRAEDMEVATETALGWGLEIAGAIGALIGGGIGLIPSVKEKLDKLAGNNKVMKRLMPTIPATFGFVIAATIATFPLQAWAARAEISASRKGRFEAMRNELKNPNVFAVLTPEQIKQAEQKAKGIYIPEDKEDKFSLPISDAINAVKMMTTGGKEYKQQRKQFEQELAREKLHINDPITKEEEEKAKRDQQLLTKLVEKIDIASQDYAENAELATGTVIAFLGTLSGAATFGLEKLLSKFNIKSAGKIASTVGSCGFLFTLAFSIIANQIQKQASRVGRFKVKQKLMNNPDSLVYIDDSKTGEIKDVKIKPEKKENIFVFIKNAWKNNKEFEKYKKTEQRNEKRFFKAVETLKLSDEQVNDAKRLQKNTFKTFNKIDENSQKYSENIEALGQSLAFPIQMVFITLGSILGSILAVKQMKKAGKKDMFNPNSLFNMYSKMFNAMIFTMVPAIGINAYITKEQKKASRVADMISINELKDFREFRSRNY